MALFRRGCEWGRGTRRVCVCVQYVLAECLRVDMVERWTWRETGCASCVCVDLFDGAHPPSLSTVTLIMAVCEGITWSRGVYGWYRSGAIAVYRSGNARVNTAFVQTAEALSGWRVKTGRDLGKGKEIGKERTEWGREKELWGRRFKTCSRGEASLKLCALPVNSRWEKLN